MIYLIKIKLYSVLRVVTSINNELFSNPRNFVLEYTVSEFNKMRVPRLNGAFWQYTSKGKQPLKKSAFLLSSVAAPIHIFMDSAKNCSFHGAVVR